MGRFFLDSGRLTFYKTKPFLKICAVFFAILLASSLTVPLLYPLQNRLYRGMTAFRDDFLSKAELFLGRKIRYGELGPSIFGVLDLRDVKVLRNDGSVMLSVSRLRLSYSFFNLLRGRLGETFKAVRVDRPILELDFKEDADLSKLFNAGDNQAEAEDDLPGAVLQEFLPEDFSIRLRNGEWNVSGALGSFKLRNLGIDASIDKGNIDFQGKWNARGNFAAGGTNSLAGMFRFGETNEKTGSLFEASMSGRVSGEFSVDKKEGRALVVIPSLGGKSFSLKPLSVSFLFGNGRLEIRKIYDKSPLDISLVYDFAEDSLDASFGTENFSLRDLVSFSGSLKKYNSYLDLNITGYVDIKKEGALPVPLGGLNFSADLKGTIPGFSGRETRTPFPAGGPASSFSLAARGNEKKIEISELYYASPIGDIRYSGELGLSPLAPQGLLSVSDFSLAPREAVPGGINADFYVSSGGQELNFFCENLNSGDLTLQAVDFSVFREDRGLTFALSALRFRELNFFENVRISSIALEGSLDYEPRHVQASLELDSISVRDILELARPFGFFTGVSPVFLKSAENLSVTTEVFFTTDYEHILYNAPQFVAAYEGRADILAVASLSGTNRRFELDKGQLSWEGGFAQASGMADFSDLNDISFSLQTSYRDLSYYASGSVLDMRSVSVTGSYGLQLYLASAGMGSWSGYAQGAGIPIPGKEGNALLSFMLSLRYDSPKFWSVELDSFEIRDIDAPGSSLAMLRLSGYADQTGGSIPDIYYDDGLGALSGEVTFSWEPGYRNFILSAGIMDSQGKEHYNLNGSYADGRLLVNLSGEGMQLARVTRDIKDAAASGAFSLDWNSIEDFKGEASLKSLAFKLNDIHAKFSAEASLDPNGILVKDIKFDYGALELTAPFLEIDRQKGLAELSLEIHGAVAGRGVDISMRGGAAFAPLNSWLDINKILDSVSGTLTMDTARYDAFETEDPFNFIFSCMETGKGRQLSLSGGPKNMIRFRYTPESKGGNFYAAFSSPSPIRGSFIGFIDSGNIDAQVPDLYVDLGALWRFVPPNDHVGFSGGIVSASLRIAGPLRDPEFFGTAKGTSVKMQIPEYIREDIRPEPLAILLEGSEMSFGPANAAVGSGSAIVSAWFRFDRWIPNIFNIDISVRPEDPIPFGFDISGILARGSASGLLKLAMEDLIFTVSGDLTGHNTEISVDGAELAANSINIWDTDTKVSAIVDLTIRTGRRVEFFWPSFELPVLQAYTDLGTSIHISSDETSRRFSLEGDVRMRSGEIFYLDRNFYIREGTLFFNETEAEFDPRITARAEIRDQTEDGPVTISMIIENAPLMSFVPRFESNPPLSQLQIFSLLGQNPQGASTDPATRNVMIGVAADAFTQFTVMRRLQREVRNFLNLDMFSVRTQVLQNVVFQAAGWNDSASSSGTNDDDEPNRTRAGNYFDNTTIFFGKYIGSDIFLQSLFTFRYDETKHEFGGMSLEPDIGLEMKNPLFNIQMNIVPMHPENWFIDDISFTLTWRRSF
jgi:hypothetical protein